MSKFVVRFTNSNPLTKEILSVNERIFKNKNNAEREISLWKDCKPIVNTELIEVPDDYVTKKNG